MTDLALIAKIVGLETMPSRVESSGEDSGLSSDIFFKELQANMELEDPRSLATEPVKKEQGQEGVVFAESKEKMLGDEQEIFRNLKSLPLHSNEEKAHAYKLEQPLEVFRNFPEKKSQGTEEPVSLKEKVVFEKPLNTLPPRKLQQLFFQKPKNAELEEMPVKKEVVFEPSFENKKIPEGLRKNLINKFLLNSDQKALRGDGVSNFAPKVSSVNEDSQPVKVNRELFIPPTAQNIVSAENSSQVKAESVFSMDQMGEVKVSSDTGEQLLEKISKYIAKSSLGNTKHIDLKVNHSNIGNFRINVAQSHGQEGVQLTITALAQEGVDFFGANQGKLLFNLAQKGVQVQDFRLEQGSNQSDQGNNNSFSENQQRGQNQHQQDSQRRRHLWNQFKEGVYA